MSESQLQKKDNSVFINKMFDRIESSEQALAVGRFIMDSGLAPNHFKDKPAAIMIAIEAGVQLGLAWFQALHNIVPINGIPMIMGDAAKALISSSGLVEEWEESELGTWDGKDYVYTIKSKRKDRTKWEKETSFSYEDALLAGLTTKTGPWKNYPKRQCRYRALGFHARDSYPEVMKGFKTQEEVLDYPEVNGEFQVLDRSEEVSAALDAKAAITNIGGGKKAAAKKAVEKGPTTIPIQEAVKNDDDLGKGEAMTVEPVAAVVETHLPLQEMLAEEQPELEEELPVVIGAVEEAAAEVKEEVKPEVKEVVKEKPKATEQTAETKAALSENDKMMSDSIMDAILNVQKGKPVAQLEMGRRQFAVAMAVAAEIQPFTSFQTTQALMQGLTKKEGWDTLKTVSVPDKTYAQQFPGNQATKFLTEASEEDIIKIILAIQ